jgi:hypothetical protein
VAGVYLFILLGFCLGWSNNLVNFESGQIQSIKLLQNMVLNRTREHPLPPPSHILSEGHFQTFEEPSNRFQGIDSASLCSRWAGMTTLFLLGYLPKWVVQKFKRCIYCTSTQGREEGGGGELNQ